MVHSVVTVVAYSAVAGAWLWFCMWSADRFLMPKLREREERMTFRRADELRLQRELQARIDRQALDQLRALYSPRPGIYVKSKD